MADGLVRNHDTESRAEPQLDTHRVAGVPCPRWSVLERFLLVVRGLAGGAAVRSRHPDNFEILSKKKRNQNNPHDSDQISTSKTTE